MATEPFEIGYPVNFQSGGDTTKEAFGKHIQEIERIYGLLNSINADKVSASELTTRLESHVRDTNPHPYLSLSTLQGNLSVDRIDGNWPTSRLSGNIPMSSITGNLDGSRIIGALSGATIETGKVIGLENYVKNLISSSASSSSNYVKLSGILLQWGHDIKTNENGSRTRVNFPVSFSSYNYTVIATAHGVDSNNPDGNNDDAAFHIAIYNETKTKSYCEIKMCYSDYNDAGNRYFNWFAIGF